MTISKERLNEIALEVATEIYGPFNFSSQRLNLNDFALALIRRVEAEYVVVKTLVPELVAYTCTKDWIINAKCTKLITLPLVSEE